MCGRFTLFLDPADFQQELGVGEFPIEWAPRYNIAPGQPVALVNDAASRAVTFMRWGLVPSWAKDIHIGAKLINARAETVAEKPSFRSAFARRRCLILANGFYEWQRQPGQRGPSRPFLFQRKGGKPFAFAGLWEQWQSPEGSELQTCTILTTAANALVAPVHERMPVILTAPACWEWLSPAPAARLHSLLVPYPAEDMHAYEVGRTVNNALLDVPQCIQPAGNASLI